MVPARPGLAENPAPGRAAGDAVQRLALTISAPSGKVDPTLDFPALATKYIVRRGGGPAHDLRSAKPMKVQGRQTLYVVTHGTSRGIIGFNNGLELARRLRGLGLNSSNLSKIVLVACSAGEEKEALGTSFAQDLASQMGVGVYASETPIYYTAVEEQVGSGQEAFEIESFTLGVGGRKVEVIEGQDLRYFSHTGEQTYAAPLVPHKYSKEAMLRAARVLGGDLEKINKEHFRQENLKKLLGPMREDLDDPGIKAIAISFLLSEVARSNRLSDEERGKYVRRLKRGPAKLSEGKLKGIIKRFLKGEI